MNVMKALIVMLVCLFLTACTSVKLPVKHEYQLSRYSAKVYKPAPKKQALLVVLPDAVAGYQTNQMLYINKPYQLSAFAHNAWTDPPAAMFFPLMLQSIQSSGYFYAVASSPYADYADFRVNAQILKLHQNFLVKPSRLEFAVKIVVTDVGNDKVVASKIINESQCCPQDTPYGGVLAANRAVYDASAKMTDFIIDTIRHYKKTK